jgi:hypothetical protein
LGERVPVGAAQAEQFAGQRVATLGGAAQRVAVAGEFAGDVAGRSDGRLFAGQPRGEGLTADGFGFSALVKPDDEARTAPPCGRSRLVNTCRR